MRAVAIRRGSRGPAGSIVMCLVVAGALAACNGPTASVSPEQQGGDISTRLGNLLAFNSTKAPGGPVTSQGVKIDCPLIQIDPGASSYRQATGEGAAGVRYQISIGDVARECALENGQLAVKVGVETNVVLGPAGSPGAYSTPLRVAIRRQRDEAILASKVYRAGGTVGANGQAVFTTVTDPLTVPFINEHAADDYEIVLGLGETGGAGAPSRRRKNAAQ